MQAGTREASTPWAGLGSHQGSPYPSRQFFVISNERIVTVACLLRQFYRRLVLVVVVWLDSCLGGVKSVSVDSMTVLLVVLVAYRVTVVMLVVRIVLVIIVGSGKKVLRGGKGDVNLVSIMFDLAIFQVVVQARFCFRRAGNQ